jgi:hypothetical protein
VLASKPYSFRSDSVASIFAARSAGKYAVRIDVASRSSATPANNGAL